MTCEAYADARLRSNRVDMDRVRFVTRCRTTTPGCAIRARSRCATATASACSISASPAGAASSTPSLRRPAGRERCTRAAVPPTRERRRIDFALEGGAIETDGAGTLLTTWQCLHERHPGPRSRDAQRATWPSWLHQDRVLWLDHGYLEGDDTDAHIDTLARFASAGQRSSTRPATTAAIRTTPNCRRWATNWPRCARADGQPYRLFPLPWAQPILDDGRRLAASYANFLIVNGAVLMPAYGDPADDAAPRRAGRRPSRTARSCRYPAAR